MRPKKTRMVGRGFWYREDDRYIGRRIALGKYEPYLTKLILENIEGKRTAVDVGANIGYYTVLLAQKLKRVWAVEPEEKTFGILKKNIEGLGNVKALNMALGDRNGEVALEVSRKNYGDHKIISKIKNQRSKIIQKVKIKKLDNLIKEQVDLIKIDVQGFENEVIEGAKNLIEKFKPTIFWEVSEKENYEKDKLGFNFLKSIYKNIYFIDEYICVYYPISFRWLRKFLEKKEQVNLVVFRENNLKIRWGGVKDFWLKKWVKRKLGRPET